MALDRSHYQLALKPLISFIFLYKEICPLGQSVSSNGFQLLPLDQYKTMPTRLKNISTRKKLGKVEETESRSEVTKVSQK